jgi:hypothetical protein
MSAYMPDPHNMAVIIAVQSLNTVRKYPMSMPQWYEGRAAAAALIYPCVETLTAHNEIHFLNTHYAQRHGRFL